MLKIPRALKNDTLPFGVPITHFLLSKKITWKPHNEMRRLRGPINRRSLQQSSAHIDGGVNDNDSDEDAKGEQDSVSERLTHLEEESSCHE